MRKFFVLLAVILISAWMASAAPACATGVDVLTFNVGGVGCDLGGLHFSNFAVVPALGVEAAAIAFGTLSNVTDGVVNAQFQVVTSPNPVSSLGDIIFTYTVSGIGGTMIRGLDLFNPGRHVVIQETACDDPFILNQAVCQDDPPAAMLVVGPNQGDSQLLNGGPEHTLYIIKNIGFSPLGPYPAEGDRTAFISHFTNSHETGIPEPLSLLLMGSGLLGLGALRWRKKRS